MIEVSNADRIVFPEIGRTKGDVVAYYERIAERMLPHLLRRPLSMRRYPKGLSGPGFFQKNVPDHYPPSIERFAIPRSKEATKKHKGKKGEEKDETVYPIVTASEHLPYVANQGAIELHVPTARVPDLFRPDRIVIDLDPPPGALSLVRQAALITRDFMAEMGLLTIPVATGSKGYHVVAAIEPTVESDDVYLTVQKIAALLVSKHPEQMTVVFRVANRGQRVFVDWLRNTPMATVVAPYSLRAKSKASIATPLAWEELESTAPDAFAIDDVAQLLDRPDTLAALTAVDAKPFVAAVNQAFEKSGLVLESFDRFRS